MSVIYMFNEQWSFVAIFILCYIRLSLIWSNKERLTGQTQTGCCNNSISTVLHA